MFEFMEVFDMFFYLFSTMFFTLILLVLCTFDTQNKKQKLNKKCQQMIQRIQPDTSVPNLTDMISYHKKNSEKAVKYEV